MYARVATWNGAQADSLRDSSAQIRERAATGPPEGMESQGLTLLIDPDGGRALTISLFETEEQLRRGDEILNAMSPPGDGMGRRTSVDVYEVAVDLRAPAPARQSAG